MINPHQYHHQHPCNYNHTHKYNRKHARKPSKIRQQSRNTLKQSRNALKHQKLYCAIKANINICNICSEEAFYSLYIPQKSHPTLPQMHLFRCGHGVCDTCIKKLLTYNNNVFRCPFCINGPTYIVNINDIFSSTIKQLCINNTYPSLIKRQTINIFLEFINEWKDKLYLLENSTHKFMILHRQIITDLQNQHQKAKHIYYKETLNKIKTQKKLTRTISRNNAVCEICHMNTFTSEKQLNQHMKAKHLNLLPCITFEPSTKHNNIMIALD